MSFVFRVFGCFGDYGNLIGSRGFVWNGLVVEIFIVVGLLLLLLEFIFV